LELQKRNPNISVRAFADRLGLGASATNEILKGERRVSRKLVFRVAAKLSLDPSERSELAKAFPDTKQKSSVSEADIDTDLLKLTADQFEAMANWSHFAILSLAKLRTFRSDANWISEQLGITQARAESAVERLTRLGLLKETNGKLLRTYERLNTTDDVVSPAVQKSHLEDMDLARESLLHDPLELRDFVSITMPTDPALIPKAKEILRRAQDEVSELLSVETATAVYRLSTYLYPLTQPHTRLKTQKRRTKESRKPI